MKCHHNEVNIGNSTKGNERQRVTTMKPCPRPGPGARESSLTHVCAVPGLDLDTARRCAAIRLVSRFNPGGNRSGIGLNEREGIAVRCRVQTKMQQ